MMISGQPVNLFESSQKVAISAIKECEKATKQLLCIAKEAFSIYSDLAKEHDEVGTTLLSIKGVRCLRNWHRYYFPMTDQLIDKVKSLAVVSVPLIVAVKELEDALAQTNADLNVLDKNIRAPFDKKSCQKIERSHSYDLSEEIEKPEEIFEKKEMLFERITCYLLENKVVNELPEESGSYATTTTADITECLNKIELPNPLKGLLINQLTELKTFSSKIFLASKKDSSNLSKFPSELQEEKQFHTKLHLQQIAFEISQKIKALDGDGIGLCFPGGTLDHLVVYNVRKYGDDDYSFTIYNSGLGSRSYLFLPSNIRKVYPYTIENLPLKAVADTCFLKKLYEIQIFEQRCEDIYKHVNDTLLSIGKLSDKGGFPYPKQIKGSCAYSGIWMWLSQHLNTKTLEQLKVIEAKDSLADLRLLKEYHDKFDNEDLEEIEVAEALIYKHFGQHVEEQAHSLQSGSAVVAMELD